MKLFFSTTYLLFSFSFLNAGFAPDSLVGFKLDETDTYYIFLTNSTLDEHDVEENELRPDREYSYQKIGDNNGVFTKPYPGGDSDVFELTFTSSSGGVITNDSNRAFSLIDLNGGFAPLSIAGYEIEYVENGETETATFASDGTVSDGEDWTYYEYEKISNDVGVVTYTFANEPNPAPEVETLRFSSSSAGTFEWTEYADSSLNSVMDQGSGTFSVSGGDDSDTPVPAVQVDPYAMSAYRDRVYLQQQGGPMELDDAGEINFDLQLAGKPTVSMATLTVDSTSYDLTNYQAPPSFRTNYGYSSFDNELFDIESSSESDWSPYTNGKVFEFEVTIEGNSYSYSHNLPAESSVPSPPVTSLTESLGWETDINGYGYQEAAAGNVLTLLWDAFPSPVSGDFITVSVEELVGDEEIEILADTTLPSSSVSYEFSSDLFESGKKYILYVTFHKVLESDNPTGFEHQTGTNTSQPLLVTTARAVTAVDVVIVDTTPVTVVSDPVGNPVVVQVGDEYEWSSNLNGVTLWSVDESGGDIQPITMRFENGRNFGNEGFYDSVAQPQPYDMPFVIDENGYIKVTEDSGYQYYHVVSVENGVIATLEGDEQGVIDDGVSEADQWFFTTRAAAEEYYYSKVNPKNWMWFDHYPWVYSQEEQGWLYFYPSGGKLLYWSNQGKAWREFNQ
jgi:hypothetical protein